MPAVIVFVAAVVVIYLLLISVAHFIGEHLAVILPVVLIGGPALIIIVLAIVRGMHHRTVISWGRGKRPQRALPPPAQVHPAPAIVRAPDPFSADETRTWQDLIEKADREELERQGPREAAPEQEFCEGPGCPNALDEYAWRAEVGAMGPGGDRVMHGFCSRECLEGWSIQQQEAQASTGKKGRR